MNDNSISPASSAPDEAVGDVVPVESAGPVDPGDAGEVADGEGSGDDPSAPRGNPWDTFRFKRRDGLESIRPKSVPPVSE